MSQNASEKTAIMCSQNNMADASFSAWPRRLVTAPEDIKITKIDQHRRLNKFFFPDYVDWQQNHIKSYMPT